MSKNENVLKIESAMEKQCDNFGKSQRGIHRVMLDAARHAVDHGDRNVIATTVAIVSNHEHAHSQAKPLVDWCVKYLGVTFDEEGNITDWNGVKFIKENFQKGKDNPYWKGIVKQNPYAFNLVEGIDKLLGQVNTARKKAANDPTADVVIDEEVFVALRDLRAAS